MTNYRELEEIFSGVGLGRRPVAVIYRDSEPGDVPQFRGSMPSGCSFWRLAAEGRTFYTLPGDHFNCAVGSYTHQIALPPERQSELLGTLELMTGIGYLKMEEVPGIARLDQPPAAVVYAPLGEAPAPPDVVVFSGSPGALMLLEEAAGRAGCGVEMSLGRPTCMALPAAMKRGVVASSGCIGNRVYTGIGEGESYLVMAGKDLEKVATEISTIRAANVQLEQFHRGRMASLTAEK